MIQKLLSFVFFLIIFNVTGQPIHFEREKIIDSIIIKNSSETYALYLPNAFKESELSSIVFIFEPMARVKIGIQPFIEAAEKYNYILVCSNNSKNGLYEENFKIFYTLFEAVLNTFKINPNLVYTAGLSGGSRLASAIAVVTKQIQGVIGCGAGFSLNLSQKPTIESFSYAGLVGDTDFNYQEMFTEQEWCSKFGVEHEIFTFEGDHSWPPSIQILKAFNWLELQAYKKGIKPTNNTIINDNYHENYVLAKSYENKNQIELSVFEYERILRNYSRYYKLDSISSKIKELKKEKQYKKEVKIRESIKIEEAKIYNVFFDRFFSEVKNKIPDNNYKWWNKEFEKFDSKYLESEDPYLKKMGERVKFGIFVLSYEAAIEFFRTNDIKKAIYCHTLNTVIFPERPYMFLRLSMDYALLSDEENMLVNLKKSIEKGFSDRDYILNSNEFSKFLENEEFKKVLNTM